MNELKAKINEIEQQDRKESIRIFGISVKYAYQLGRMAHRLGYFKQGSNSPIIGKMVYRQWKEAIMPNKYMFVNSKTTISDWHKKHTRTQKVWTVDGKMNIKMKTKPNGFIKEIKNIRYDSCQ